MSFKHMAFLLPVVSLAAAPATANVVINGSVAPVYDSLNDGAIGAPASEALGSIGADLRTTIGYTINDWLLVGGTVNFQTVSDSRDATTADDALDQSRTRFGWGPSVGLMKGGFIGALTYLASVKQTIDTKETDTAGTVQTDQETVFSDGSGIQLAAAYGFQISKQLLLGPSLVYRNVSYKHLKVTDRLTPANNLDQDFTTKRSESSITPMINLTYKF